MADRWGPLLISLGIHALLLLALGLSLGQPVKPVSTLLPPKAEPVQAVAVDEQKVQAELERLRADERQREQQQAAEQRRRQEEARQARQAREREERRVRELKRKAAEAERQRQAAEETERKRLAELKKEQEALAREREAEQRRLAELEQKRKMEAERQRQAEEERKRREQEAELKAKLEAEQRKLEAERQAAEAARSRELQTLQVEYVGMIAEKVRRYWLRPAGSPPEFTCKVLVHQIPGGEVVGVQLLESCGSQALDRSVENAVRKASPLPAPPDPSLFDREIEFTFIP